MENSGLCISCQKALVVDFETNKCLDCAIVHMRKARSVCVAMLTPAQLDAFHEYEKALDERLAIQITAIKL